MSRISFLYDVLNKVIIDAQMDRFKTSEATLCDRHLGFLKQGDLVIFDRYYASHYLFTVLTHKKVHFLFRMRDHSWTCVKELVASRLKEKVVELNVYPYSKVAKKIPANVKRTVQVRLIKQVTRSGEIRVYATSLLDEKQYSRTSVINLYKLRWGVEESYKTLKARLDVVHFSGKTVHAVQQDFYAKVFLISLTSILKTNIHIEVKRQNNSTNNHQRKPIINNAYAISQAKMLLQKVYSSIRDIGHWIDVFEIRVSKAIEFSRIGQSNPRKPEKGRASQCNQNYKLV